MTSLDVGAVRRLRAWAVDGIFHELRARLRGHDLMLLAAAVTFYACLAVVPLAVVSLRLAGWLGGDAAVADVARVVGVLASADGSSGAAQAGQALTTAALHVPWPVLVASVLPGSLYADGLRRALARLGPGPSESGLRQALRSRLLALVGFGFVACGLVAVGFVGSALTQNLDDGAGSLVLGVYLAFLCGWGVATLALACCYRLGSGRPVDPASLWTAAAATGSMVAGMSLGLVAMLRLPLSFGRAYGGFRTAGILATAAGWLWLVHAVVLVGYLLAGTLSARRAVPVPPVERSVESATTSSTAP